MHGLFVASGPDILRGPRPAPFDSVHLYALFCRLMRISPGRHDGDARVTAGLVRQRIAVARRAELQLRLRGGSESRPTQMLDQRGGADQAAVERARIVQDVPGMRRLAAAMIVPAALFAVSRMARRQPYRWRRPRHGHHRRTHAASAWCWRVLTPAAPGSRCWPATRPSSLRAKASFPGDRAGPWTVPCDVQDPFPGTHSAIEE